MGGEQKFFIGVDVGGTTVDAACVSGDGRIAGRVVETRSPSRLSADEIIDGLADMMNRANLSSEEYISACGIGMPGPFDYERGVSYMEHKFQAIRGMNIKKPLEEQTGLPVRFVKDSAAFGLGVRARMLPDTERFMALTIGTGFGSCFIENCASIEHDPRVPEGGELWNRPYGGKILDDIVSGRGITELYRARTTLKIGAKAIEQLAREGHPDAIAVYEEIGEAIGHGVKDAYGTFQPQRIVIGGKVAKAIDLFGPAAERILRPDAASERLIIPATGDNFAVIGAAVIAHR